MRSLVIKLAIFIAPFSVVFVLILLLGIQIGELVPEAWVIQWQQDNETAYIYQPTWQAKHHIQFKYHSVALRSPKVLVIGSSRMFLFQDQFLNRHPEQFYNASVGNFDPSEMSLFIEGLAAQSALPPVIILGIDLPYLNKRHVNTSLVRNRITDVIPTAVDELGRWRLSVYDLIQTVSRNLVQGEGLPMVTNVEGYQTLGLKAVKGAGGYRNDGSWYHNFNLADVIPIRLEEHESDYASHKKIYINGSELDEGTFNTLTHILQIAQEQNSVVIGVVLPYRESFFTRMIESGDYDYIPAAIPRLETLFESYEAPLFDFSTPQRVGGNDDELFDGWHPGNLLSLRLFAAIVRDCPEIFAPYVDLEALETIIANADDPLYIPE